MTEFDDRMSSNDNDNEILTLMKKKRVSSETGKSNDCGVVLDFVDVVVVGKRNDCGDSRRQIDAIGHAIMKDELGVEKDIVVFANETEKKKKKMMLSPVRERRPRRLEWRKRSRESSKSSWHSFPVDRS